MDYIRTKRKLKIKRYIQEIGILIIGCALMAFATSFFLLPNQLSAGGFTGLATITYYLFKWPVGTVLIILNVPLYILAYFRMGKEFVIKGALGTIFLSVFIDIFDKLPALTSDSFLGCIYGGIVIGIGSALVLKASGSTGGSDLLSYIIKSYFPNFRTSNIIIGIDIAIITLNILVFKDIEIGLYSAITIYLMGKMIDIVFEGIYFTKVMFIVSDKYEKIAYEVGKKVQRGSTGIYAKGMHTNKERMMLLCVGSRNEIAKIKQIAVNIDDKAFIIVFNAREAWGKGFKREK